MNFTIYNIMVLQLINSTVKDIVRLNLSYGGLRSNKWSEFRLAWLKLHPFCRACGGTNKLEVHHKYPFHLYPSLELNPHNYITLCEDNNECHLKTGHHSNWKNFNPTVVIESNTILLTRLGLNKAKELEHDVNEPYTEIDFTKITDQIWNVSKGEFILVSPSIDIIKNG